VSSSHPHHEHDKPPEVIRNRDRAIATDTPARTSDGAVRDELFSDIPYAISLFPCVIWLKTGHAHTSLELLGSHFDYSLDAVEVLGRDEVTKIELLCL